MNLTIELKGRLFKAHINGPMLYYFASVLCMFSWTIHEGWHITNWKSIGLVRQYIEAAQGGKLLPSNKLLFLVDTGMTLEQSFSTSTQKRCK